MSTLKADTIQSTGGGTATLTKQNASKGWVNFNGVGTIAIRDTLNVGSLTDNGTGDYETNLTASMSNANFGVVIATGNVAGTSAQREEEVLGMTSSQVGVFVCHTNTEAARDVDFVSTSMHGELA